MKKALFSFMLIALLSYLENTQDIFSSILNESGSEHNNSVTTLAKLFQNQISGTQVAGEGRVSRLLADDNDGSKHQKFILELSSGQTLLISHNIDLAPRIDSIARDDKVSFYGEYEWSSQGGVMHWTHHDPAGRHVGGWLQHNGRIYE